MRDKNIFFLCNGEVKGCRKSGCYKHEGTGNCVSHHYKNLEIPYTAQLACIWDFLYLNSRLSFLVPR